MSMSRKKMKIGNVATLVAEGVTLNGDIELKGHLIVAGNVNGAIKAEEDSCVVTVAETGCIKGELTAPVIEILGKSVSNIKATEILRIGPQADVSGTIEYASLEISAGGQIVGDLAKIEIESIDKVKDISEYSTQKEK